MSNIEPTAAQARYRMRFSTHVVPDSAKKSIFRSNHMWLGQAMAFIAVFSLVLNTVSLVPVAKAVTAPDDSAQQINSAVPNQIPTVEFDVNSNTSAGENLPGWMFNRDTSTDTPFAFDNTTSSIGTGSLHILPIGATAADKMVAENFINAPISTVTGISYDYKIGAGGDANDDEQFYMNVYANFGVSDDLKYYDCRYDVVPTIGSTGSFTTVSFDPTQTYPVTTRGSSPSPCPPSPSGMDGISAGSNIRAFALNVGDTSTNDLGLDGFLDKVVVSTNSLITTYDFEPTPPRYPVTVTVSKVWQDANGSPIDAPAGSKDDITITVTSDDQDVDVCEYNDQGVLACDGVINTFTNQTINIIETGLPSGWEVVPSTVGNITPVCPENVEQGSVCTATVINKLKVASPCGLELVTNGGFELPEVTNNNGWEVFPSGSAGMAWSADWVRPAGAPLDPKMELHEGVNSWVSHGGNQHTELDSDWAGPATGPNGEDASIKLYQDLITKIGGVYDVSVWTSPRPGTGTSDNVTEVKMGATVLGTITEDGLANSNTVWTKHTYTFTATSGISRLSLTDMGAGNSLGAFIDDVSVKEQCLSDVTICKYDNNENPLSGWDVFLKGPLADTVTVNSTTGIADLSDSLTAGEYVLEASGTYTYRPGSEGDVSDAAFSKRVPSDASIDPSFYAGSYLPWVRNLNLNGFEGYLGIRVNNANFNWGSAYAGDNKYSAFYTLGSAGQIPFSIIDDNYSDNSGSLTVKIYPVVKGTTGLNGCITLENVPLGNYTVDELMKEGWDNVTGQNAQAVVDQPTETFNLVNVCESEKCRPAVPQLHFIKVVCDQYSDVAGNADADNEDDTGGMFTGFSNYSNGNFTPSPLLNGLVSPSEIPGPNSGCSTVNGWQFQLSDHINQLIPNNQIVGPTVNGEFVTPISGPGSALSPEMQTAIVSGQLWVSEVEKDDYDFAAIRCYKDALNGDNLEYISLGEDRPDNIYCIAYNISTVEPCVVQDPAIASGASTYFKGLATSLPADLKDVINYPNGPAGAAVAAGPTGYPGAWDGPQNDPNITEGSGFWVSNSAAQPTNPPSAGGDGSIDTWRLYTHTFTIPADATSLTPATLYFSADNEVTAFLDDVQVGTNNSFATAVSAPLVLTPGQHTLKFSVKNWAFQPTNNPTGLIYNLDFTYCGSDTTQGEPEYHVTGAKWNDDGNGIREEEAGIQQWPIYLTRKVASFDVAADSSTGVNTPTLTNSQHYLVKINGTFDAGDSIVADAQYSDRAPADQWTDLVQTYESYGPELLDLQMNGISYDWGMYNSNHTYWLSFFSDGSAANFKINDVYYPNNSGSLNVEIYEVIQTEYTDENGNYDFNVTGLGGEMYVVEGMVQGWNQTAPIDGVYQVTGNQNANSKDFGNHQMCMQQNYDKKISLFRSLLNIFVNTEVNEVPYCGNGISGTKTQTGTEDQTADDWTIYLDLNHNNALDDGEPYDVTDSNGDYSFSNLPTGTYHVREVNREGWTQTVPGGDGTRIVNVLNSEVKNVDFTNNFTDDGGNNGQFSIAGEVYHDNNANNGTLDEVDEDGLQTWVVYLDENGNNALDGDETSVNTDSNGNYLIEGLVAGCYTVREVTQADWVQTEPVVNDNEYNIGIGGAIWPCDEALVDSAYNSEPSGNGIFGYLFKTAKAEDVFPNYAGNATGLNFGNIEADRGGNNGGGGSRTGSRPNPPGQVLGDSTTTPSEPQVLGATLPVTGSPTWVLLVITLLAAPMLYFRKIAIK
jgi:hypothetical protein